MICRGLYLFGEWVIPEPRIPDKIEVPRFYFLRSKYKKKETFRKNAEPRDLVLRQKENV